MRKTFRKGRREIPGGDGLGIDASGGPTVDPTENVKDLSEALSQRQDDLRELTKELFDTKIEQVKEIGTLRALHQRELDHGESERLNSIRQVDREEVTKTAASANQAIATLASQTSALAETLRVQVGTVAAAAETRLGAFTADVNKRLSALELSSSEGKGKQTVADPQLQNMVEELRKLTSAGSVSVGKTEGLSLGAAILMGAVSVIGSLLGIAGILYAVLKP